MLQFRLRDWPGINNTPDEHEGAQILQSWQPAVSLNGDNCIMRLLFLLSMSRTDCIELYLRKQGLCSSL